MANEKDFYVEVGRRVRQTRLTAGVTQKALADRVSLSRASITNVESGRQKLLLHTLVEIAAALRVLPADLLPPAPARPERPLGDLLRERPDTERAWIGPALSFFMPAGPDKITENKIAENKTTEEVTEPDGSTTQIHPLARGPAPRRARH